MGEQQALAKLVGTDAVQPGLYLSSTTTMLSLAITFGQVRCEIMGPNCGRLAIKRHTTPFDAMNQGYSETPPPHSRPKEWNLSLCVKKMVLSVLFVTNDQLVYHSLHHAFPQPARLLPMFETSQGLEVATHQRLLFRTHLTSRSMLRPKYRIWDDPFFPYSQRCGGRRGPPMYPSSIGIACGMRRRVC